MPFYRLGDRQPQCAADSWVAENATLIGSVVLEAGASVFFGAVLRGDNDLIRIGASSNVQDNATLHTDAGIELIVGQQVTIGHQAVLHGCRIGDGSLIGIGAIVLNRAEIGRHSIVAAGAMIPEGKIYPERSLILGAPARVVREITDEEIARLLHGAEQYKLRAQRYAAQLRRLEAPERPQ